jgi:hypothetical protein
MTRKASAAAMPARRTDDDQVEEDDEDDRDVAQALQRRLLRPAEQVEPDDEGHEEQQRGQTAADQVGLRLAVVRPAVHPARRLPAAKTAADRSTAADPGRRLSPLEDQRGERDRRRRRPYRPSAGSVTSSVPSGTGNPDPEPSMPP